jgi:hypothetical protein
MLVQGTLQESKRRSHKRSSADSFEAGGVRSPCDDVKELQKVYSRMLSDSRHTADNQDIEPRK